MQSLRAQRAPEPPGDEISLEVGQSPRLDVVDKLAVAEPPASPVLPRIPTPDLVNVCVLAALIGGLAAFNYAVDPFGANNAVDLGLEKRAVSRKLSYWNWEAAEYAADPAPAILLGDSRMVKIPEARVSERLGVPVDDLAYGGGTLADALSTYWFAAGYGQLTHVFLGFNFNLLNDLNAYDRAKRAQDLLDDPLRYYFSPFITQASARVVLYNLGLVAATSEAPPMDPEAFWDYQLTVSARNHYRRFAYPEGLLARLDAVAAHAADNGIQLTLVYFPTHADLQAVVPEYGLTDDYERSKTAVAAIARARGAAFYDYDYDSALTRDRASFSDPYHFSEAVAERLVDEFTGGERWMARP